MQSTKLATSIFAEQKGQRPKSIIMGLSEQFGLTWYGSHHPELLPFQLYETNFNLFMSYLYLILNHLMRIRKSVHWISFGKVIASDVVCVVSYIHTRAEILYIGI